MESTQPTTELLSTALRDVTLRVKKLKCEFLKTFSACFNARLPQSQSHEVTRPTAHGKDHQLRGLRHRHGCWFHQRQRSEFLLRWSLQDKGNNIWKFEMLMNGSMIYPRAFFVCFGSYKNKDSMWGIVLEDPYQECLISAGNIWIFLCQNMLGRSSR